LSPVTNSTNKLRKYLFDRVLITDLVAKLVITFGVVLIAGGLYLMLTQASMSAQSIVSAVSWVPGIPFYVGVLSNVGSSTVGLVVWLIGLDLLVVGLGLWVRHVLARFTALTVFALASCFQFVQCVELGILGAPASAASLCVDAVLAYFLFSRFDSVAVAKSHLTAQVAS